MSLFVLYWLAINVVTFAAYGIDKFKAMNGRWRIKEATLLGLAVVGGSIGAVLGMYLFRHKTKKPLFTIGIPAIIVIHAILLFSFPNM